MPTFPEFESYDAVGLAGLVRAGDISARDVVGAAIERIEQRNPDLNAVVTKTYNRAMALVQRGIPDGPLTGVPFLLKNLAAEWAGVASTEGSRSLRWWVPDHTSTLVSRYEAAGLVILGKTNTPEFGLAPVTEPELHGITRNPWDLDLSPGGSSGGAASAVAASMVPAAHASDGGGSIRVPASLCGLFGLKPTTGRNPTGPKRPEGWFGMSVPHVVTRSVRDSAAFLDATHGPETGDRSAAPPPERPFAEEVGVDPGSLRIGVVSGGIFHDELDPECRAAVRGAADLLHDLGHRVQGVELPVDVAAWRRAFLVMAAAATAQAVRDTADVQGEARPRPEDFELSTRLLSVMGRRLSAFELADAMNMRGIAARAMGSVMQRFDVILASTMGVPRLEHGALRPTRTEVRLMEALRRTPSRAAVRTALDALSGRTLGLIPNTPLFNMTGQPAMSMPLHWTKDGLPVGVQFAGRFGDEATLFRLASQLEQVRPWFHRRPEG